MREFVVAFRHLAPGTRQALLLATVEGHSYKQIAKPAGISVGTVKSRISRGRMALQQMLAEKTPIVRTPALHLSKMLRNPGVPERRIAGRRRPQPSPSTAWAAAL
jgi:hypothetical protein